jgi:hypothetical protein
VSPKTRRSEGPTENAQWLHDAVSAAGRAQGGGWGQRGLWRGQFSMHSRRDFENDFCLIRFNFVIAPCFSPKRSRIFQQKTTDAHIERPHGRPQPTGCPQWCTSHTGLTATGFPATGHSADHTHTCHYHQHQPRWARWARWKSMEYIVVMVAGLASCGAYLVACGRVASWFLALGPFLGFFSF